MANNFKVRDLIADNVIINGDITTVDSITFDTAAVETSAVGKFKWNDEDGTLDLGLKGGNVTLQVGQETVIRAVNKTNTNLLEANYQVARIRTEAEGGSQGQRLAIVLAQANNDNNSVDTLGLVTENIDNNQEGFVTIFGLVRSINTTGSLQGETWADGDVLYLSPTVAGRLTNVKPEAPQHTVIVGFVVYSHINNGKIFVKVDNGYELNELHNVKINGVTNNNILAYDSLSGVWKNSNSINVDSVTANNLVYNGGNTGNTALTIGTNNGQQLNFETNNLTRMIVTSGGDIGINVSSVQAGFKFEVAGLSKFSNELYVGTNLRMFGTTPLIAGNDLRFTNGNSVEIMRLSPSGNVGIGTTTPNERLTVSGNISLSGSPVNEFKLLFAPRSAQNITQQIYSDPSDQLVLGITSAGKRVYIGSSALTYALGSNFYVDRLSIGTTAVNEKLNVSGNINAIGNVTANNLIYNTGDQTIAGVKTFSDNIISNGTSSRLPNQTISTNDSIITRDLADSRFSNRYVRITGNTIPHDLEQFVDFVENYTSDITIATAIGTAGSGPSAVFGDSWTPANAGVTGFLGNDAYAHKGILLYRGQPAGVSGCNAFQLNRPTSTNLVGAVTGASSEITVRAFLPANSDFATKGYFKVGPIQKGGTGPASAALGGGMLFNPYVSPNLIIGVTASGAPSTNGTFTTIPANVSFVDTNIPYSSISGRWINFNYRPYSSGATALLSASISRENIKLFETGLNISTLTWTNAFALNRAGASYELGFCFGSVGVAAVRSEFFIDYIHYKVTGSYYLPTNWNSLRF